MGHRWASPKHLSSLSPLGKGRAGPGQDCGWDWQWSGAAAPALAREREPRIPEAPGFPGASRNGIGDRSGGALSPHPAPALSPQRGRPAPRAPDVDAAAAAAAAAARESLSAEPICRRRGPARGGRAGRAVGWSASGSGRRAQESPCPSGHRAPGRPAPRSACGWAASASRWCRRVRGPGAGAGRRGYSLPSYAATGEFSVPFPLPEDLLCPLLPTLLARPQRLRTFLTPRPVLQPLNLFPGILGS